MKTMGSWQMISFVSRGLAMAIGLIQSFVIIRLLSVSEWGIIQLGISIGGALGVYQHLGLASASTREIASAKNDSEVFKIFVTSVAIRYFVTLPIAICLFLFAHKVAVDFYHNPALVLPLRIYAVTLLFLGFQSILNSVISGTKRFKSLFIYQVAVSVINISIFTPMVLIYRIDGYFWAYLIFNALNTLLLAVIAFKPLKGNLHFPKYGDFKKLFREIFSISIVIYAVKILATNWEKLGTNILGLYAQPELVAIFAFALLYSKKILSISDAVTDVSLPIMSEKYSKDLHDFKSTFSKNFDKVFGFILLASAVACFWSAQIIGMLVGDDKYSGSYGFIPYILLAFVIYSVIDIIKSSVFVPAKMVKEMLITFIILLCSTISAYFVFALRYSLLTAMTLGIVAGAILALAVAIYLVYRKLSYSFFSIKHWLLLFQAFCIGITGTHLLALEYKLLFFPLLLALQLWALAIAGIFRVEDIAFIKSLLPTRKK